LFRKEAAYQLWLSVVAVGSGSEEHPAGSRRQPQSQSEAT
jgi:hypothetical protein